MHSPCWSTVTHTAPGSAAHSASVIRLPRRSSAKKAPSRAWVPLWAQSIVRALPRAQARARRARTQTPLHNGAWALSPRNDWNFNRKFREATPSARGQPRFLSARASDAYRSLTRLKGRLIRRREQRAHVLGRDFAWHADRHRRDFLRDEIGLGAIESDLAQPLRNRKAAQQGGQALRTIAAERSREPRLCLRRRRQVETRDVGQDDRVGLGVRQAEAAEHVRELVLQPGA